MLMHTSRFRRIDVFLRNHTKHTVTALLCIIIAAAAVVYYIPGKAEFSVLAEDISYENPDTVIKFHLSLQRRLLHDNILTGNIRIGNEKYHIESFSNVYFTMKNMKDLKRLLKNGETSTDVISPDFTIYRNTQTAWIFFDLYYGCLHVLLYDTDLDTEESRVMKQTAHYQAKINDNDSSDKEICLQNVQLKQ